MPILAISCWAFHRYGSVPAPPPLGQWRDHQLRGGRDRPGNGPQEAGQRQRQGGLPRAVGSGDGQGLAGADLDRNPGLDRPRRDRAEAVAQPGPPRPLAGHREPFGREQELPCVPCRQPQPRRRDIARHPDARTDEHVPRLGQDPVRRPVDQHRGVRGGPGLQHHDPVHQVFPDPHPVLHDHQGGAGLVQAAAHGIADLQDARGVEVGGRLVEQQQPRPHREDPGERQPLLLSAGEGRRRVVQRQPAQPDVVERLVHARPDLRRRDGKVLRPEGDVVAEAGKHHLRFRVLLHKPGAAALRPRRGTVDQQASGLVRVFGVVGVAGVAGWPRRAVAQHTGQGMEQRRFAGAGGAQQEHALPGPDVQVQAADRGPGPSGVPPAPAAGGDGGGPDAC